MAARRLSEIGAPDQSLTRLPKKDNQANQRHHIRASMHVLVGGSSPPIDFSRLSLSAWTELPRKWLPRTPRPSESFLVAAARSNHDMSGGESANDLILQPTL